MTSLVHLIPVTMQPSDCERELRELLAHASQSNVAACVGLACHTTISERIGRANNGNGYLEAFTASQLLKLARSHGPLAEAVRHYIDGIEVGESADLHAEITACAEEIAKINDALADGKVTKIERHSLAVSMRQAADRKLRLAKKLGEVSGA